MGSTSAFGNHVTDIIPLCAQEEMRWIYARWVVTGMKNLQSCRNWTVVKFPTESMRQHASLFGKIECAIAPYQFTGPDPTARWTFAHTLPEFLFRRLRRTRQVIVRNRAEIAPLLVYFWRSSFELDPAPCTSTPAQSITDVPTSSWITVPCGSFVLHRNIPSDARPPVGHAARGSKSETRVR